MTDSSPTARRDGFDWLLAAAVLAIVGTFIRVVFFTPIEARQGAAQKIMYLHVSSAFIGLYVAFMLVAVAGALYLWLRDERLDRFAASAAEVGVVYMTVVLITGPLWGKPIWGTYWTWDARLTLTLFLWFVFVGYLIMRGAIDDTAMRARYSAVLGLLGALLVPFVHLSVYMFRTLHPMPIILKPSRPSLPNEMLLTFVMAFVSFLLLFVALVRARYRLAMMLESLDHEEQTQPSTVAPLRAEPVR
jgi:heme exporter protein C